ncbi:2-methylaconitate cis-trans isomerase PrpF [Chitinivorax sp. B]|uniref:2-methylaconitate cis-trans isomerase PrpF n=1 Tax=Chitinivorax sp. B TaxID=2502235 RepID=UPI0010F90B73
MNQLKIPAALMRGGTSKGLFFRADTLPADPAMANRILLRAIGSPDPYGKQIDGVGGGTSSTSKVVLVSVSSRDDADVDYLFGHVSIEDGLIDFSGNCGNLTAAVGPFAIEEKLVTAEEGITTIRIWQANINKLIVAYVPVKYGQPVVEQDFQFDGVAFPGADIKLEFLDPAGGSVGKLFPTGNKTDTLELAGIGKIKVTLIDAGNPTVFVKAKDLGLTGLENQVEVNHQVALLSKLETIRAHAAVAMGLAATVEDATTNRPATPKISFLAKPADFVSSSGKAVSKADYDLSARIVSMGKLHHAYTGTGAIALTVAAYIPGTVVSQTIGKALDASRTLRFGQPSGVTEMAADVQGKGTEWTVSKVVMHRSARRLMEGSVLIPMPPELAPAPPQAPASSEPNVWVDSKPDKLGKAKDKIKDKTRTKGKTKKAAKVMPEPSVHTTPPTLGAGSVVVTSEVITTPVATSSSVVGQTQGNATAAEFVDGEGKPAKSRRRRRRKPKVKAGEEA